MKRKHQIMTSIFLKLIWQSNTFDSKTDIWYIINVACLLSAKSYIGQFDNIIMESYGSSYLYNTDAKNIGYDKFYILLHCMPFHILSRSRRVS